VCIVKFGTYAMPVTVAVDDGNEAVAAVSGAEVRGIRPK
jgi:hypothetical protein